MKKLTNFFLITNLLPHPLFQYKICVLILRSRIKKQILSFFNQTININSSRIIFQVISAIEIIPFLFLLFFQFIILTLQIAEFHPLLNPIHRNQIHRNILKIKKFRSLCLQHSQNLFPLVVSFIMKYSLIIKIIIIKYYYN